MKPSDHICSDHLDEIRSMIKKEDRYGKTDEDYIPNVGCFWDVTSPRKE